MISDQDFHEIQQRLALDPHPTYPYRLLSGAPTIITGQVDSTGAINAGTGFAVDKTGTGTYDITFDVPFATVPTVVACATTGNVVAVTAASATGFSVTAFAADKDFNFIAVTTT